MKVLVLMSGSSQAFKEAGFGYPKNLAEIAGKPMVQHVMEALAPLKAEGATFICVLRREENLRHHTGKVLQLMDAASLLVETPEGTAGAACSALMAADHLAGEEPLVIVNGDQIIEGVDPAAIVRHFRAEGWDAGVVVFEDVHPRWSFVKCGPDGLVVEAAEKRPISKFATAGFYYFARSKDFTEAAMRMILKDAHVHGAFYICPTLNELILRRGRVGIHRIPRHHYWSLASPADVKAYVARTETRPTPPDAR
jgi:dTDP-glucose pyrophosphorylase